MLLKKFQSLSVARKMWVLFLGLLLCNVLVAGGLFSYLRNVEQRVSTAVQATDKRINLALRWQALTLQAGQRMDHIVRDVRTVSGLIASITEAAQAQNQGIAQISEAVQALDHMTSQNAGLVAESSAAAHDLFQQAQRLESGAGRFRLSASHSGPFKSVPMVLGNAMETEGLSLAAPGLQAEMA